jgi:hypothetical protein
MRTVGYAVLFGTLCFLGVSFLFCAGTPIEFLGPSVLPGLGAAWLVPGAGQPLVFFGLNWLTWVVVWLVVLSAGRAIRAVGRRLMDRHEE